MIRGARAAGADVAQVAAGLPPLEIPEQNNLRRTVYEVQLTVVVFILVVHHLIIYSPCGVFLEKLSKKVSSMHRQNSNPPERNTWC